MINDSNSMSWTRGDLAYGFSSYARHLGYAPSEVVFINSLVVNPVGKTWRMTATDDLEGVSTAYTLSLSGPGSTALHFPLTRTQQSYVSTYLAEGELKSVEPVGSGRRYPEASIITALSVRAHTPEVQKLLRGKVIANSYVTEEVEELAAKVGGHTLMTSDTFLDFVGKEYLHKVASEAGFAVAPGVVVREPDQLFSCAEKFRRLVGDQGLDPDKTKTWVKPTSLSGGQGVINIPGASMENLSGAFMTIGKAYQDCGFYGDNNKPLDPNNPLSGIQRFMPIVMEIDIGSLPNVSRKLDDAGVKAIIGDKGVVHIENTLLSTQDGHYLGSRLPQTADEHIIGPAEAAADRLMQRMWKDGYRGYISVNAVVVEKKDGGVAAYMNDINTRLSGASPLLGLAHRAMRHLGHKPHAFSLTRKLALAEGCTDAFEVVADRLDGHLYRGAETGYTGIIPAVVDVPRPGQISWRAVVIARDADQQRKLHKALTI